MRVRTDAVEFVDRCYAAALEPARWPEVRDALGETLLRDLFGPAGREADAKLRQLGLRPAEARVAALVGQGRSPRTAAAMPGLREGTVRTQLRVVFGKLGIRRQSELAVLVTRLDT